MKKAVWTLVLLLFLGALILSGPRPSEVELDPTPLHFSISLDSLDAWISGRERIHPTLKPGNEARIEWYSDPMAKTEYAVVYLHGFTASHEEGSPVHRTFAQRYGCNLYLSRLYGHGLDTSEPLIDLTPENYLNSAKEAVAIGKRIGDKVILMCTSTGGTLGIFLAAHDPEIDALICYSPNIDIFDPRSKMLTMPWGLPLARVMMGGNYRQYEASDAFKKYWQTRYRLEGLIAVRQLIDETMTEATFSKVSQPILVGAYYKNEQAQDSVISVRAIRHMLPQLATPERLRRYVEFPVGAHVLTNPLRNPSVDSVEKATFRFAEEVLGLEPVR